MSVIIEIIAEFVFQILVEFLLDAGGSAVERLLESKVGSAVASATFMAAFGFAGGYAWGRHLVDIGWEGVPRTIWVSLGLAAVAGALARRARDDWRWARRVSQWPALLRPSAGRLATLSLLNVAIALGVAVAFR